MENRSHRAPFNILPQDLAQQLCRFDQMYPCFNVGLFALAMIVIIRGPQRLLELIYLLINLPTLPLSCWWLYLFSSVLAR